MLISFCSVSLKWARTDWSERSENAVQGSVEVPAVMCNIFCSDLWGSGHFTRGFVFTVTLRWLEIIH